MDRVFGSFLAQRLCEEMTVLVPVLIKELMRKSVIFF